VIRAREPATQNLHGETAGFGACPSRPCKRNSHSRIPCIRREIVASSSRRSSRDCKLYLHSPLPQISVSPRSKGRASVWTRLDFTAYGVTFSPRRIWCRRPLALDDRRCRTGDSAKDEKLEVATKHPTRKLKQYWQRGIDDALATFILKKFGTTGICRAPFSLQFAIPTSASESDRMTPSLRLLYFEDNWVLLS
jgi:hypothetical protein